MPPEQSAAQPTLIFIPDISGFTQFVNDNEIRHAQHIVEELLEILIDANEMGLEVSEIEGDAILFYRKGRQPTAAEILAQVQRMYTKFHGYIKRYDTHRICQCGACSSASGLELKFILHYGDIADKQVKNFTKLFGKDLIIAHRLMKNSVQLDEYVLFTHQLLNACSAWVDMKQAAWDDPADGEDTYDNQTVKYCYLPLEPLKVHVPEPRIEDYSVGNATHKGLHVEGVINAPLSLVFNVVSDVSFRDKWIDGVQVSADLTSKITNHGSTHRCVMGQEENDPYFISHDFKIAENKVTWTETNHKVNWDVVIMLERIGKQLTRIHYTFFVKPNLFARLNFRYKHKKMLDGWVSGNFKNLDAYCKSLVAEGKNHPEQITIREPALVE